MATIAGIIKSLSNGIFSVKDENGNIRVLAVGDEIHENDTVYGDNSNSSSSEIKIQLSGNDVIVLNEGQKQLIDSSLIETAFGTEELFFTLDGIDLKADQHNANADVVSDLRAAEFMDDKKEDEQKGAFADANNPDITEEKTTEGKKELEDEETVDGGFQARSADATDVNSDLRNAQFRVRTQIFREVDRNDDLLEINSKNLGERSTSFDTSTSFISTTPKNLTPFTPTRPESEGPIKNINPTPDVSVPPITAPIIIANLSVNDITQYESEGFLVFTVTLDKPLGSSVTFDYKTSPLTASPNGKDYTDVSGKITIPAGSTSVTIRVPITDDYISDNGETIKITISNVVGNVNVINPEGIGTILDNSKNTPDNPYDETTTPAVEADLDIITVKLYAISEIDGSRQAVNSVKEGGSAEYIAIAFDPDGNEILAGETIQVRFGKTDDTATAGTDYVATTKTVTIGTKFSTPTTDDNIGDDGEKYSVQLKEATLSNANKYETVIIDTKPVKTTITDEPVILKIVAYDATSEIPLFETDGKTYKTVNDVAEGNAAKYMVFAFKPGTTDFNSDNLMTNQGGTVTINTKDTDTIDAKGVASGATNNKLGDEDYTSKTQTGVIVGTTVISVQTLDDLMADNGEKFEIIITSGSYTPPVTPIYENVTTSGKVTTTITDNSEPNTPNDLAVTIEPTLDKVLIKLFAADENGNVIKDGTGNYQLINSADEVAGSKANYIGYAFKDGEATFNDTTRLTVQVGQVNVEFTDGTATGINSSTSSVTDGTQDYNKTAQTIIIGESFSTEVFKDTTSDLGETYTVKLIDDTYASYNGTGYESVDTDNAPVTTTIKERLYAKIEVVDDEANESETLSYKLTIVDETGAVVTVTSDAIVHLEYTGYGANPADSTSDYTPKITITVPSGGSTTTFTLDTTDDYFAEDDEQLQIIITEIVYNNDNFSIKPHTIENKASADLDTVIGTIKDNPANDTTKNPQETPNEPTDPNNPTGGNSYGPEDTVYVKLTKNDSVVEGNTLTHTVTLVDKDGTPITVPVGETITVTFEYSTDTTENVDFKDSTKTTTVTITSGNSTATVSNITIDDFTEENPNEVYTLTITDVAQANGTFENVAIHTQKTATGEILDGVTLGTPVNAKVDEDDFVITDTTPQISKSENLGITTANTDEGYTLSFDNTITVYKGDTTSSETNIYGDSTGLKSGGVVITYELNGDTITGKAGTETVFTITLNKNAASGSDDNYTYTQYKNIDHPVAGVATDNINDDEITFKFGFNINDQGEISTTQTFKVTVNDSMPFSGIKEFEVVEDSLSTTTANTFIISQENFKDGKIEISNDGGANYTNLATNGTIDIKDPNDSTKTIGTLINNGDGTVIFVPIEDYSNYNAKPTFSYKVSDNDGDYAEGIVNITVKPVADAPTIKVADVVSYEDASNYNVKDDGNKAEGGNKIPLGLETPTLSKDTTDENTTNTGDKPEKNGEITLTFVNGDKVTGAKIFNGATQIGSDITTANQTLKVVIVTTSGDSSTIDYTYHHADITASNPSGAIYLTEDEYKSLIIQHAEDNDTDIKIDISVTSYELDDSNKPLSTATYGAQVENETTETMTVKIHPATDDISLIWDTETGGTITQVDNTGTSGNNNVANTFTFTTQTEGEYFTTPIDLKGILTKTNGTQNDVTPLGGDLDGSEKRTYTVTGIPEGTVIILGTQTAVANASGIATLVFNNTNNEAADPEFSMKLPEHWSGSISNAKIILSVQDKGVDSGDTAGTTKTTEVYFNVTVTSVADLATIQVSQAIGFEDAGRDGGNTIAKSGTINANGTGGIPLAIKVSSDDKDGSETFDVTINAIPTDAVIYYDGVLQVQSSNSITIIDFDNTKSLVIIPPHNSDADFTLNVSAVTKDGLSTSAPTTVTTIDVIVKNIADAPVGIDLNTNININEDNQLNFSSIYTTPENLASYDDTEVLTVKINLPTGFTIDSGSPFYIENGMSVVKASDIADGNIKLNVPTNFSGTVSFDLTYVTTEKAGEGDSKTWNTQTVSFFVNPIADDVTVAASSTINEDVDGSTNKIDLKPTLSDADTDGNEAITGVKILASDIPAGYEVYLNPTMTTSISSTLSGGYYVLTQAQADSVYAKNTTEHDADNVDSFDLTVVYTVTDTNVGTDTKDFTHTHTVNVQAVTDAPTLTLGTITQESGNVTIGGSTVTIVDEGSEFKVPVTTTSSDEDGSETITKIVISGVPMGVEVAGATYYGYSGSVHNGIWEITTPSDGTLDANGALANIVFTVNQGADFAARDITITTYTQDGANAEVESASQTIHIDKTYTSSGPGTGTPPLFDLSTKAATIYEDNNDGTSDVIYNLGKSIDVTNSGGSTSGNYAITLTDFPAGTIIEGASYSYEDGGKTYYVVVGTGSAADVETKLSTVLVTPPTDMNTGGDTDGQMTFSATVSTFDGGTFAEGTGIPTYTETIIPVTDAMTVAVTADNIDEDGTSNLSITLTNPNDGTKTELVGSSLTIKVSETWKDSVDNAEGTKGTLTQTGTDYIITESPTGTYTITKTDGTPFTVDTAITGLQYTPASNRDGDVKFEVSVKNKETGSTLELDSTGDKTITVTPIVDAVLNAGIVTAIGTEDTAVTVGSKTLGNPVKLEITSGTFTDGSEKLGNIILDEVPNGFTVWYNDGTNLVMATNIGITGGTAFDVTPGITGDTDVTRNKWLVPSTADGSMPEVYINAPTNWSGDFDFNAVFSVKEQNLTTSTPITASVTGHIDAVADGVTIAPTLTFGDAFSWVDLKLNANMADVDGSETMSLEITGLNQSAQFQLADGTAVNATLDGSTWKLDGIAFDQINNIQFIHDKDVASVGIKAKTIDSDDTNTVESSLTTEKTFELSISDVSGTFKLDDGLSLNFDNIDALSSSNTLKNIDTIDLTETGENKLSNLSLQDILDMTDSSNELKITGIAEDQVSFKNDGNSWFKVAGIGTDAGFDIYSNNGDNSVKVKVQTEISDGITA